MKKDKKILSDIITYMKYAKYLPGEERRETWEELVNRNMQMHIKKYPEIEQEIRAVYHMVIDKKILPSMRGLQFGGAPVELANNRMYNCAYMAADSFEVFHEAMFLLLGGTGLGYSVQFRHIKNLPTVKGPLKRPRKFLVGDNIEGWADAVRVLFKAHFQGKSTPVFDYRDIREKGAPLITSGGKAPGSAPLKICINQLSSILDNAKGRKLTSLEVHSCFVT